MNWKRIFRNLALAVGVGLAIALIFGSAGQRFSSLTATPEVQQFVESSIIPFNGTQLAPLLEQHKGKPQIVFVYASWCPFCKRQFSALHQMEGAIGADAFTVHHISVDDDVYALAQYLTTTYGVEAARSFAPYHVAKSERSAFTAALQRQGGTSNGAIPYIALFDKQGVLAKQFVGLTRLPVLLPEVEALR